MGSLALHLTMGSSGVEREGVCPAAFGEHLYTRLVAPSQVLFQARRLALWKQAKSFISIASRSCIYNRL